MSLPGRIVCVSNFIKRVIIENTGINEDKLVVIKNPIDFESFSDCRINPDTHLRNKLGITKDEVVILFVGRIVENKGIKYLLQAMLQLEANFPVKLIVIGSFGSNFGLSEKNDGFKNDILSLAKELGEKVIFTGFVNNLQLPAYHSFAHIVTMPSWVDESAGKVAMEALASGLPVITTTAGGIPEYITQEAGILLDRDDQFVENLKKSLETLINDADKRLQMGNMGKKLAFEFHPNRFYNDYINLVNKTS